MRFRARKRLTFGPLYLNLTQRGVSSWGVKVGPYSHNMTTGKRTFDTPGPGSLHLDDGGRRTTGPLLTWRRALAVAGIVGLPVAAIVTWLVVAIAGGVR